VASSPNSLSATKRTKRKARGQLLISRRALPVVKGGKKKKEGSRKTGAPLEVIERKVRDLFDAVEWGGRGKEAAIVIADEEEGEKECDGTKKLPFLGPKRREGKKKEKNELSAEH